MNPKIPEDSGNSDCSYDGFLRNARAYLSGPMDFVACRASEKQSGWRVRVRQFLNQLGVEVFDPWEKPEVLGMYDYGREGEKTTQVRYDWTFESSPQGREARSRCCEVFRETQHLDLRMVDVSDFVIAFCPTNIYSVGTPHEIIVAREQHKPVLFVSPPVDFPSLKQLKAHLRRNQDLQGLALVEELEREVPIKPNQKGIPSLWYMPLIGSDNFFDGFGFESYRQRFQWPLSPVDQREQTNPPQRPLLPFLEKLNQNQTLPLRWSERKKDYIPDDNWILLDLKKKTS